MIGETYDALLIILVPRHAIESKWKFIIGSRPPHSDVDDRWVPLPQWEVNFSQGPKWTALISRYIKNIPVSGDASRTAEHSTSGGPPSRIAINTAMSAKVAIEQPSCLSTA
jgi:hypothetical protein